MSEQRIQQLRKLIEELDCDYDEYPNCKELKKELSRLVTIVSLGKAENYHSDKGYTESTLERQQEFELKRNYHYTNTLNPIDFPRCPYDEWKPNRDIV